MEIFKRFKKNSVSYFHFIFNSRNSERSPHMASSADNSFSPNVYHFIDTRENSRNTDINNHRRFHDDRKLDSIVIAFHRNRCCRIIGDVG